MQCAIRHKNDRSALDAMQKRKGTPAVHETQRMAATCKRSTLKLLQQSGS
jgi:hypothetical protein